MEERIARICYNELGWTRPSGKNGKGTLKESYEFINSFGHEEWLLDKTKILDGYHYSFLEPIQGTSGYRYAGNTFDIHLFAYSKNLGKIYLGVIRNVECIDKKLSLSIRKEYIRRGWLEEMKRDVRAVGGKPEVLDDEDSALFNIRFRFSDVHVNLSNPKILSKDDPSTRATYYKLYIKKGDFVFSPTADTRRSGGARMSTARKSEERVAFNTDFRRTSYDPQHNKIQNAIKKILEKTGQYTSCELEKNYIDLTAVTRSGEIHFYEIKTAPAKASIREALGQIMEYAYYPSGSKADKLVIVAPEPADEFDIEYLENLRVHFKIPVWFRYYSFDNNSLSELL